MASIPKERRRSHADYTVACICPMGVELAPVEEMMDEIHESLPTSRDQNAYTLGHIGGHNVVVAVMPEIGNNAAATVATQLMNDFCSVRFGLLVGIGGGVPSETGEPDIRLGDVVVSQPTGTFGGVIQYDLGKRLVDGRFERIGQMNKPPAILSASVRKLQAQHFRQGSRISVHLSEMIKRNVQMQAQYSFPADHHDQVFLPSYAHQPGATCGQCDPSQTVSRPARPDHEPRIHYGMIGSANMVVKDGTTRDGLKKDMDILCVEMEAAGLMNGFPCLVIRGICDYADSHKNKRWQPYAAAVAAAYMKELLMIMPAQQVVELRSATVSTSSGRQFSGSQRHAVTADRIPEQSRMATGQSSLDPCGRHYPSLSPHGHSQTPLEMCTIREHRLTKSTASNDEIESMGNDEIGQCPTKRRRLDEARALCTFAARQQCPGEQSQLGKTYGDISIAENRTTHIKDRIIHSCDNDHDSGQSRREALLESLTFDRMDARLRNVTRATPKTCDWLFRHKDFKAWLQDSRIAEHHGFLWIKGKPGSGKSTIMKNAWDWAKKRRPKNIIVLSYFFNARAPSALEKSCLGLYRSLVHQILCEVPESKPIFFDRFLLKERNGIVDEWTQEELQDFLIEVVKTIDDPLQIFIDALDEGDENDVRKMIDFLQELGRHSESSFMRLRICLSSRHYPHISIRNGLSLIVEHQPEHQQDIETYVRQNFVGEDTLQMVGLQEKVCLKADGVFLWVVLVVCMLKKEYDHGGGTLAMTKLLDEIPKGLEGLFAEILKRSSEDRDNCISLLQWVLYSTRPLNSAELYLAIQFSQTATSQVDMVLPDKDQLNRRILKYSRGLVEQTKSQPPIIQFIHETVRDFLTGEEGLKQLHSALTEKIQGWSNDKLKDGCLRYIQRCRLPKLESGDKNKNTKQEKSALLKSTFPLIDYAVGCLFRHADAAEKNGVSQTTFLQQMQRTDQEDSCNWMQWRNAFERYEVRKYRDDVPLLYILVEYNLPSLIEALVSRSVDLDAVGGRYGTALQAACFAGHEDITRFLLQNGASVNKLGGEYTHALLAAIYSKKPNIIVLLRQHGASLAPSMLTKPLFEMLARNYTHGIQVLMEYGVDMEARNRRDETPLYVAAGNGNIVLVDLFLQRGTSNYSNALQAASTNGHKIVQMLLDVGADVNAQGGYHGNALQAASSNGHEKIVQMLLNAGADVNAQGGFHGNALQAASRIGHEKIVQMLLDVGANVNAQGGHRGNALQTASINDHEKIVQMLLDAGADVNAQGGPYGNAMQAASRNGHEKIVQMLLDAGADVNAQGGCYDNALQAASSIGHEKIVQMLLDAGVDVNAQGGCYDNTLQAASSIGHEKIVQMLLDAGVDVNAQGGFYGNALQAASSIGHEKIVQMLLDAGADVNAQGGCYGNALQAASRYGFKKVVQILRNAGAVE